MKRESVLRCAKTRSKHRVTTTTTGYRRRVSYVQRGGEPVCSGISLVEGVPLDHMNPAKRQRKHVASSARGVRCQVLTDNCLFIRNLSRQISLQAGQNVIEIRVHTLLFRSRLNTAQQNFEGTQLMKIYGGRTVKKKRKRDGKSKEQPESS